MYLKNVLIGQTSHYPPCSTCTDPLGSPPPGLNNDDIDINQVFVHLA